ncbi:MAG: hypothetical protein ABJC04_01415 [Verrucomicrobiota bacterium]
MIEAHSTGARSLLDVGCNTGWLTALAAEKGFFSLGLETNWEALVAARKQCKPDLSLAFMHFLVTPENIAALPVQDVVLCLSVYHQWHRNFGHDGAQKILKTLGTKAQRWLFFEPASKQSKYGPTPPDFTDQDERSIVDYNLRMLRELFGGKNVAFLGATEAGRSEPFRYLFAIQIQSPST